MKTEIIHVQFGDTWLSLAEEFKTTREELIRFNPHKARKDALHVGEPITVPVQTVEYIKQARLL